MKRPEACNFIKKETLAQVFSCEFCEISKNTSYKIPPVIASENVIVLLSFFFLKEFAFWNQNFKNNLSILLF